MSQQQNKKSNKLYVQRLKAGQKVKTPKGEITARQDETSIYIPEDMVLKKGTKLYLNKIEDVVKRLVENGHITQSQADSRLEKSKEYNQTHEVSVFTKEK